MGTTQITTGNEAFEGAVFTKDNLDQLSIYFERLEQMVAEGGKIFLPPVVSVNNMGEELAINKDKIAIANVYEVSPDEVGEIYSAKNIPISLILSPKENEE